MGFHSPPPRRAQEGRPVRVASSKTWCSRDCWVTPSVGHHVHNARGSTVEVWGIWLHFDSNKRHRLLSAKPSAMTGAYVPTHPTLQNTGYGRHRQKSEARGEDSLLPKVTQGAALAPPAPPCCGARSVRSALRLRRPGEKTPFQQAFPLRRPEPSRGSTLSALPPRRPNKRASASAQPPTSP